MIYEGYNIHLENVIVKDGTIEPFITGKIATTNVKSRINTYSEVALSLKENRKADSVLVTRKEINSIKTTLKRVVQVADKIIHTANIDKKQIYLKISFYNTHNYDPETYGIGIMFNCMVKNKELEIMK